MGIKETGIKTSLLIFYNFSTVDNFRGYSGKKLESREVDLTIKVADILK